MKPIILSTEVKMLTGVIYKHRNPTLSGRKRIISEGFNTYKFSHKLGKLVNHQRLIDRENDKYIEIVIDEETDHLLHYCNEKLSSHQGHGSAKNKKQHNQALHWTAQSAAREFGR